MIDYSNIPRDSRRVPLETRVQFKFDRFSGFLSEYSANISPGGMFIRTLAPQPPGSVLEFEFRLGDGFELIKGRGEVVWTRAEDDGVSRPAGMGIRFLDLSQGSKDLIYRIVDQHILQGGTPFDVTQRPPDPVPIKPSGAAPAAARTAASPLRFDLPPSPSPTTAATGAGPETPEDATSWLPALEEPGLEPPPFAPPQEDWMQARDDAWMAGLQPWSEPLPAAEETPPPDAAEPAPLAPPAPMFASLHGAAERPRRRMLPLIVVVAVLALGAGAWLARGTLLEMMGQGDGEDIAPAPLPSRQPKPAANPPPQAAEVTPSPAAPAASPEPTPAPASLPPATLIEDIGFERAFGGTDVILQGNGAIRAQSYDRERLGGNPPRELFRLSGIRSPFPKTRVVVGTPEVLQVRVGYHPGNELHVVLDLAHPTVKVTRVEEDGNRLRIHLQRE
jgi:uncharacterized protein (TIGR02266 family)